MFKKFLQNWSYPKHATAVSGLYLGMATLGNAFLGKEVPADEKSLCPANICKQMTKKQWVFNGILTGLYAVDMSATYLILRHYKKQYK
ncbi:MAG: hypothetical protein RR131_01085 [Anaerovorax sp.]